MEVCSFEINGRVYTIYNVEKIQGKESRIGEASYEDTNIYIEYGSISQMLLTLKHELMHVWLYENGHKNQDNNECFSYEEMCELVALSNRSINKVVDMYCNKFIDMLYNI